MPTHPPLTQPARPDLAIEMVDLKRQYARLKEPIDTAMAAVLTNTAFINGPDVKHFAAELGTWLGALHVIPCANGTDALQIVLMAFNLPAGAEVIVPAFNYVATAEVIALLGLKPVFVDVDPLTFSLLPAAVEAAITPATKVIMPVHLFGQCAPMVEIMAIAHKHELYVVEDNAQAIGAKVAYTTQGDYKRAGLVGHAGTTSFFPSKNLGCMGDGGAIYLNDSTLAERISMLANHGQRKKYTYELVGVNSRLDTLQAALLRIKLQHLSSFITHRQVAALHYDEFLANIPGVTTPSRVAYSSHVFHQYTLILDHKVTPVRDEFQKALGEVGIPSMVYYPKPLHLQPAFAYLGFTQGQFPNSEALADSVLSLPIHSEITLQEQEYIAWWVRKIATNS
jgi:UDP-2-acetamido-2-deoxy-ribo-hexuluronate aminotransferase